MTYMECISNEVDQGLIPGWEDNLAKPLYSLGEYGRMQVSLRFRGCCKHGEECHGDR